MPSHSYLVRQASTRTYFFRNYIPADLVKLFDDKREFRLSLGCKSKQRCQPASFYLHNYVQELYAQIRLGAVQMTIEDIKAVLKIELEKSFRYVKRIELKTNTFNAEKVREAVAYWEGKKATRKEYYSNQPSQAEQRIEERISEYERQFEQKWNRDSLEYLLLKRYLKDLHLERLDYAISLLQGNAVSHQELFEKYEQRLKEDGEWLLRTEPAPIPEPSQAPIPPVQEETVPAPKPETRIVEAQDSNSCTSEEKLLMSELMPKFMEEKKAAKVSEHTLMFHRLCQKDFLECVGDMPVTKVNKAVVRQYLEIQKKLPPQRGKTPRYADKTVAQILQMKFVEPQSLANINKKVSYLKMFFKWVLNRYDEVTSNPLEGMNLAHKTVTTERGHFTEGDLQKILGSDYLPSTVYRMDRATSRLIKHGISYYWTFLIGIYSGMRTEEICKLEVDEIQEEEGIWFFDIKGRVKTKNAIRRVPIHKQLLELGLLKYVEIVSKERKERLFWELPSINEKYSKTVSKFFNDNYLRKAGVYAANSKILYSTRHTFVTTAKTKGMEEALLKELIGHEQEFTQKHYAANMFDLAMLQQGVNQVEYPKVDVKGLKVKWDRRLVVERRR